MGQLARKVIAIGALLGGALLGGCSGIDDSGDTVPCTGKCDAFSDIKELLSDPGDLNLDDLVRIGAPYATDAINDALEISDYGSIEIALTRAYDASELDALVTGLGAQFGEKELSTEINDVRVRHLDSSSDGVFAEAAFEIKGGLQEAFDMDTGGFAAGETKVGIGFSGQAALETRVVAAFEDETDAILTGPLAAIKQSPRGFILPRSLEDIRDMKPGELVAMNAHGHLGVNLGVGVPILIADPFEPVSYKIVLSAGVRTRLEGDLDVQLIRMDGDEIVIDVGIEKAKEKSREIALKDGWGVSGLVELEVDLAGVTVDLGRIVDKAVERTLNRNFSLIAGLVRKTSRRHRMSVARLRFNLDAGDPELLETAIAQALRGDVRLGQALANRKEPGVRADFDLMRAGASTASYAGIDIFGMKFFTDTIKTEGNVVIQTPGGARALLFDSLHEESGLFLSRHGFTRVALSGLVFDPAGGSRPEGEANLFVQLTESDKAMEREKFVDWLDGIIVGVGGPAALTAVEDAGNRLEILVETECAGTKVFDECPINMLTDSRAVALRDEATAALSSAGSHLDPKLRTIVQEAGRLRLLGQSVFEQKASLTGPGTWMVADFRLDNAALEHVMSVGSGGRLTAALKDYLTAIEIDREASPESIIVARAGIRSDSRAQLDQMAAALDDIALRYRKLEGVEEAVLQGLGNMGSQAVAIQFSVDSSNRPIYAEATSKSVAHQRASVAGEMFDTLRDEASKLGNHAEQVAAFGLLRMTDASRHDVRMNFEWNLEDGVFFWREPYREAGYTEKLDVYGRGSAVQPIDGGLFNVDDLIDIED